MDNISMFITTRLFPKLAAILFTGVALVTGAAAGAKMLNAQNGSQAVATKTDESGDDLSGSTGATGQAPENDSGNPEVVKPRLTNVTVIPTKTPAPTGKSMGQTTARVSATATPKPAITTILPKEAEHEDAREDEEEEQHATEIHDEDGSESGESKEEPTTRVTKPEDSTVESGN